MAIEIFSIARERTVVILNMDGEIGVAGFVRYMCRGPSIDFNGLVGAGVIRGTCSHFEEVLVCHSSCEWAISTRSKGRYHLCQICKEGGKLLSRYLRNIQFADREPPA